MILPSKHISIAESLFGLGGYILSILDKPKTLEEIWKEFSNNSKKYPAYHGFDNLVLAIDYLYMIGSIEVNKKGKIYHAIN